MLSGYYYLGCSLSRVDSRVRNKFEKSSQLDIVKIFRKGVHLGTKYLTSKDDPLLENFVAKYNQLIKGSHYHKKTATQSPNLKGRSTEPESEKKPKNYTEPTPKLKNQSMANIAGENSSGKAKNDASTKASMKIPSSPFLPDSILRELDEIHQKISMEDATNKNGTSAFSKNSINMIFGNYIPPKGEKGKKLMRTSSIEDMERQLRSTEDFLTENPEPVGSPLHDLENPKNFETIGCLSNLEEAKSVSIQKAGRGALRANLEPANKYNIKSDEERYLLGKPGHKSLAFAQNFTRKKDKQSRRPVSLSMKIDDPSAQKLFRKKTLTKGSSNENFSYSILKVPKLN